MSHISTSISNRRSKILKNSNNSSSNIVNFKEQHIAYLMKWLVVGKVMLHKSYYL